MQSGRAESLWQHVKRIQEHDRLHSEPDGELLRRFAASRDESAFDELLRRYGPLVWGVCARLLGRTPEAEDAFQAVFLILVRKAGQIQRQAQIAGWLHGTAQKVVRRARKQRLRRDSRERPTEAFDEPGPAPAAPRDWLPLLDGAIQRLPKKYREVLILCELQERSRSEAARLLSLSENTLSSRLARAKEMLRGRLEPTGIGLPAGAGLALAAPEALRSATLNLCQQVALHAGEWSRIVPAKILPLLHGGSMTMFATKFLILPAVVLIAGFGLVSPQESPKKAEPPAEEKSAPQAKKPTDEKVDPKPSGEKKWTRVEKLRLDKVEAAKEWLAAAETRVQLGKDPLETLLNPAKALARAKLDMATSNAEREAILVEQKKFFEEIKELTEALVVAGSRTRKDLAELKVNLLDAEIELELFRDSLKEATPPRK
jgi:RNA polymerase sigma factor (sigma-70 family)